MNKNITLSGLKFLILFVLILVIEQKAEGQELELLSRSLLEEDLKNLESQILTIHPGLKYYSSTQDLPALFESIRKSLPEQMTAIDFLVHIAPIVDSIKCGHTGFNIKKGKRFLGLFQKDIPGLFPIQLMEVEGSILIKRNLSNDTIRIQDNRRLLRIDGQDITAILQRLSKLHLGSDGDNQTGEINFALKYFMLAYKMFYGARDTFNVTLQDLTTHSIEEVKITSGTLKSLRKVRQKRYPSKGLAPIQIRRIEGFSRAVVLDVNTFSNTKWDYLQLGYRRKIRKAFKLIEAGDVEYLIVDLRDNPGGVVQNVVNLMKYTYDSPFILSHEVQLNRSYFKSKVGFFHKVGMLFRRTKKEKDHIRLKAFSGKRYKPKKHHRYQGNMIILINEGSFSAACTYALFAKSQNRAILLGEEAGGSYHIVSAGVSHDCHLKNTDLALRLPIMNFQYNVDRDKQSKLRGVLPHIAQTVTIEDHLKGIDSQLEAAMNLIKMHLKKKEKG